MKNIANILVLIQQISGKSQTELASDLGVSFPTLNSWINEKSRPRDKKLQKILEYAKSLGLNFDVLEKETLLETKLDFVEKVKDNFFQKILKRKDLLDELSLQITYHTNSIEGSTMTADDTMNVLFHKKTLSNRTLNEQLEVKNHDLAFRYILEALENKSKIDENFVKKIHAILMAGILENAGMYRNHPVRIVGSYVPTANFLKIEIVVKKLFVDFKSIKKIDVYDIFKFHADFEKIHPFSNGNGRVGRLILITQLLQKNFPLALIKTKVKNKYYKALQDAQMKEEFANLNNFLLDAVIEGYKILAL